MTSYFAVGGVLAEVAPEVRVDGYPFFGDEHLGRAPGSLTGRLRRPSQVQSMPIRAGVRVATGGR